MERTNESKIELRLETQMEMEPRMAQLQIQEEREPNAYTHRKTLLEGSSLYVTPPLVEEERYDLVLITPDKSIFHFNRNRAYLPRDIAIKFFSVIRDENDFDLFFREYWEVLKKLKKD